jgi:hypothetical protein
MTSNNILIIFYSEQKTGKLNVSVIMNTLGTLLKCQNEKNDESRYEAYLTRAYFQIEMLGSGS